jgi:enoyl-CoA hydratase
MPGSVGTDVQGAIGWLILDNPERRNAVNLDMYTAIPTAVAELTSDPAVRVIILRGAGDEAFNAGSDISEFQEKRIGAAAAADYAAIEYDAWDAVLDIEMPVIALIHGPCMGGGTALALCADIRFAADDARFAVPPAKLGVGYPPRAARALGAAVGMSFALEMVFTAEAIDAQEALRIGLVSAVIPKLELDTHVATVASRIADNAPLTLRATKLALRDDPAAGAAAAACFDSADYREGIAAFTEKRRPKFEGR